MINYGSYTEGFMDNLTIRQIRTSELFFLEEMLFEAIFIAEGEQELPRAITRQPEINKYINDFGKLTDFCLVAELNNNLVGAIWTRIFDWENKGYGFVDAHTPELSIAISRQFRNQGIGSKLMDELFFSLQKLNFKQVSLSVDIRNPVFRQYLRYNFQELSREGFTAIMVKILTD